MAGADSDMCMLEDCIWLRLGAAHLGSRRAVEGMAGSIAEDWVFDSRMNLNVCLRAQLAVVEQNEHLASHLRRLVMRMAVEDDIEACSAEAEAEDWETEEYGRIVVVLDRSSCLDLKRLAVVVVVKDVRLKDVRQRRSILLLPLLI